MTLTIPGALFPNVSSNSTTQTLTTFGTFFPKVPGKFKLNGPDPDNLWYPFPKGKTWHKKFAKFTPISSSIQKDLWSHPHMHFIN